MLYQVGDYVVKANSGICKIEEITHLDMPDVDKKVLYYLMIPQADKDGRLYVPVEGCKAKIRDVISEQEAWGIIERIPYIERIQVPNEKLREQQYKDAIQSCEPEQLVSIIKDMYFRMKTRDAQGKKNTALDERFFKAAEEDLYSELAFAIGKDKSEIRHLIAETIKKNGN